MAFNEFSLIAIVAGGLLAFAGLRIILRRGLLPQILMVLLSLCLLGAGMLSIFGGIDLLTYRKLLAEEPVATLRFVKTAQQAYQVMLVDNEGGNHRFHLNGDQWQLDVRIIKWGDGLAKLGAKPVYRLDRISGRYRDLRQEITSRRTAFSLDESPYGLDLWLWLKRVPQLRALIDTQYGSATFLPMADDAVFEVHINAMGLVARPVNETAKRVVDAWELK